MIGWYVHHHGLGHLHRARAVISRLTVPVTVLSSLPRPADWQVPWVDLDRDDGGSAHHPDAGGRLHWAPQHDPGLRSRMASLSTWVDSARPDLIVCDVSVEVALMSRLHGVPVVCVVMPGDRSDAAHGLGYGVASELIGCWPREAHDMVRGLEEADAGRLRLVGALSRYPVARRRGRRPGASRVTVFMGAGGSGLTADLLERARTETPCWEWTVLGGDLGTWEEDPFRVLRDSDVVVTHAGENALAEVAAARRPAVVIPDRRPHGEQVASARALRRGPWPALVQTGWPTGRWTELLRRARDLDGEDWSSWCDDGAAQRFADIVQARASDVRRGVA